MYTEEYENRGFPFRDFLLKLILIIIFVFLLVWLLPKFIKPQVVENCDNSNSNSISSEISALQSQIFADNLNTMKEAAISYYTDERLPKEIGQSETMTLGSMIEKKLLTPLYDKNNKPCDEEASYVKITKADDEYILKVNLKDSEQEDYILVHLGCYTYCDSYVCEKEKTQVVIKGAKEDNVITVKPSDKPAPSEKPTPSDEPTPTDKPVPSEKPTPTDKPVPSEKPTPTDKPVPSDKPTPPPSNKPTKTYLYEYKKTTSNQFSNWTSWSAWAQTSCNTKEINCSDSSASCLKKLQLYSRTEKIGSYDKKYVTTKEDVVQTGSYTQKTCSNYNYVIINNTTYTTTTNYTVVNNITSSTAASTTGWKYNGRKSYKNPPKDTATTHYEFVGADYSYCEETCTTLPNYYYDSYTYTGTLKQVSSTTSTPSGSSTSSSTSSSVEVSCGSYVTKTVPIYGTISKSYIATRREPLYGTVCYQSTKTRKITDYGKTQYKWSKYNDTALLNNGWYYTGASKVVS